MCSTTVAISETVAIMGPVASQEFAPLWQSAGALRPGCAGVSAGPLGSMKAAWLSPRVHLTHFHAYFRTRYLISDPRTCVADDQNHVSRRRRPVSRPSGEGLALAASEAASKKSQTQARAGLRSACQPRLQTPPAMP